MLTGDGKNRWVDKSLNYVITAGGRVRYLYFFGKEI